MAAMNTSPWHHDLNTQARDHVRALGRAAPELDGVYHLQLHAVEAKKP